MRPLLLDLFCGQGGAGMGYYLSGFDIVGVDIDPQPEYPFRFVQADALTFPLDGFHAVHASPPCQAYSTITPDKSAHPQLIGPVRDRLAASGLPYVIENVEGARRELVNPIRLCGSSFGLGVRRHRWFESNVALLALPCTHDVQGTPVGVYGDGPDSREFLRPDGSRRGAKARSVAHAREAMGMPWADWHGCAEAVPPAFTHHIGSQLLEHLAVTA